MGFFLLWERKGVARFESDILRMKSDVVTFWKRGSLGNSVLCNVNSYHEHWFFLVQKTNLSSPIWDGGDIIPRYLRLMACLYIINFRFLKVPKSFSSCLGISCQLWGPLDAILTVYWISPFWVLQKFTSRKGMIFLSFQMYFHGFNSYETYFMPYSLVLYFQWAIFSWKRPRDDQDTHFPR